MSSNYILNTLLRNLRIPHCCHPKCSIILPLFPLQQLLILLCEEGTHRFIWTETRFIFLQSLSLCGKVGLWILPTQHSWSLYSLWQFHIMDSLLRFHPTLPTGLFLSKIIPTLRNFIRVYNLENCLIRLFIGCDIKIKWDNLRSVNCHYGSNSSMSRFWIILLIRRVRRSLLHILICISNWGSITPFRKLSLIFLNTIWPLPSLT